MAAERDEARRSSRTDTQSRIMPALLAVPIALLAGALLGWWLLGREARADDGDADGGKSSSSSSSSSSTKAEGAVGVKYVRPRRGGLTRTTSQPGVVHPFEAADLYAKASGFLRAQVVDIGDVVQRGQILAEVYDPERQQAVEEAAAAVAQAKAHLDQARAEVVAAEAEVTASAAEVEQRRAEVGRYSATRKRAEKEYLRYQELAAQKVVDERLVDEKQEDYESARAAEAVAEAAVRTAEGRLAKAEAQVVTSKANVKAAEADVLAAEARLSRAQILADYINIISPYDGVVTARNYHRGDFIRAADQSGQVMPVLSVARTDLMRVVVYVPDDHVPDLDRGDEAVVRVDALDGEEFRGTVSRYADAELSVNRSMRAEVDLPNPAGRLKAGMYGMTTILLESSSPDIWQIPSSALVETTERGRGTVYVVRDGKAAKVEIRVGRDDGKVVEVLEGLSGDERVVTSYSGALEDGDPVEPVPAVPEPSTAGESSASTNVDERQRMTCVRSRAPRGSGPRSIT